MVGKSLLLLNASIFDDGAPQSTSAVLIQDGVIAATGASAGVPSDCEVVDVAGRTVMPGLIDAHTHVSLCDLDLARASDRRDGYIAGFAFHTLSRMLDRGFTTIRDAGGTDVGIVLALQEGLARGPRVLHSGRFISQTAGHFDVRPADSYSRSCCGSAHHDGAARFACIADGADEVRRAVREELRKGASQIKLMASGGVATPTDPIDRVQFSADEIRAAVEETTRRGSYVMAHCHPASAIKRCAELGVRSIEHGSFMDTPAAEAVAEAGAYVVPTMATVWALTEHGREQGLPAASQAKAALLAEGVLEGLQIMRAQGLKIGFGTDLMGPQQDEQINEFHLRADIFSAREILRSATQVNAELVRMSDQIGRVAQGYVADLIVVDGDPVDDLSLLADPDGAHIPLVIQQGKIVKRTGAFATTS